jgi:dinuclear metal center YbgI/SA1388 family protein
MSVSLHDLVAYCDNHLGSQAVKDYCPNGLQVEAGDSVRCVATAVTANEAAIDAAISVGADLLLVHHGYFWRGEPEALKGMKGRRVAKLFRNNISLLAYHLPLDLHPVLGNNAQLGRRLGWEGYAASEDGLIWMAHFDDPVSVSDLLQNVGRTLGREPLHIPADKTCVSKVAWCTGAAQSMLPAAEALGAELFLSGEISEPTVHQAREMGIHYVAAGHHATERYGVKALGDHLGEHFGLAHHFIDIANPV